MQASENNAWAARRVTDIAIVSLDVRFRGNSRPHLLTASISPFDPSATLAAPSGSALDAGFRPYQSSRVSRYNAVLLSLGADMRRREFITLLGGAAATWPFAARAQKVPVIGFLSSRSPNEAAAVVGSFLKGLAETGYVDGRNVIIEYRWAEGNYDHLTALAADLVRREVVILVTTGGEPSALAAKAATSTIPNVFTVGGDPVKIGLVASLNRPGGNATGVSLMTSTPESKRLGLLHDLVPSAIVVGVLINPQYQEAQALLRELQEAARVIGLRILVLNASSERDIDKAFATLVQQSASALIVTADPFMLGPRNQIVRLAATQAVSTIYFSREFVDAGGLMRSQVG